MVALAQLSRTEDSFDAFARQDVEHSKQMCLRASRRGFFPSLSHVQLAETVVNDLDTSKIVQITGFRNNSHLGI